MYSNIIIIESVESISRDGPDTPIYIIHSKSEITRSRSNCKFYNFADLIFGRMSFHRAQDRSQKHSSTREPDSLKNVNCQSSF